MTISRIDVCFPQSALAAYGLASQCAQASVSASDPALDLALLFVSLEGTRFLAGGIDRVESLEWTAVPISVGQRLLPAPTGWIAEVSGPSARAPLPPPAAVTTLFPAADSTITMRAAVWPQSDIRPESAASSCSSRRGSGNSASHALPADFLGVSYVIEGVFASIGAGQVVQLEVVAPDRNSTFARGLLAAWLAKTTQ